MEMNSVISLLALIAQCGLLFVAAVQLMISISARTKGETDPPMIVEKKDKNKAQKSEKEPS